MAGKNALLIVGACSVQDSDKSTFSGVNTADRIH
jgi:hypothetical protein